MRDRSQSKRTSRYDQDVNESLARRARGQSRINVKGSLDHLASEKYLNPTEIAVEYAELREDLAERTQKYGNLAGSIKDAIAGRGSLGVNLQLALYNIFGQKDKSQRLERKLAREGLIDANDIANKLEQATYENLELIVELEDKVQGMKAATRQHMQDLLADNLDALTEGTFGQIDSASYQTALKKFTQEVEKIDEEIVAYKDMQLEAKQEDDIALVEQSAGMLVDLYAKKNRAFDEIMNLKEEARANRRDSTEARHRIDATEQAYETSVATLLTFDSILDTLQDERILYEHTVAYHLPVLMQQASAAVVNEQISTMNELLGDIAESTQRLMTTNAEVAVSNSKRALDMITNPQYDLEQARQVIDYISGQQQEQNQLRDDYANMLDHKSSQISEVISAAAGPYNTERKRVL